MSCKPKCHWHNDRRVYIEGLVERKFTPPWPRIALNPDGTPQDRGGRMPKEWWDKVYANADPVQLAEFR